MKNQIFLIVLFILFINARATLAQEYTNNLGNNSQNTVEFVVTGGDVVIEGYDGDIVKVQNLNFEPPPERAEGLELLTASGKVNPGVGLQVREENGTLHIVARSRNRGDFRLQVPDEVRVLVRNAGFGGSLTLRNLTGEIEVRSQFGDITLSNITGPVVANSTSGSLEMTVSELSQAGPTAITVTAGYIDLTLPATTKADLILSSVTGEIYTDMDIEIAGDNEGNMRLIGGRRVEGTLNGGGVKVKLKTISGAIYLRRK